MRILIVDDEKEILSALAAKLREASPGAQIDLAGSLEEAIDLAEAARADDRLYDVAVLDFLLPRTPSDPTGFDQVYPEHRRRLLGALGRETATFHYTTHIRDDAILKFLVEDNLRDYALPRPVIVDRRQEDWREKLVDQVQTVVHSRRIGDEFHRLFGHRKAAAKRASARPAEAASLASGRLVETLPGEALAGAHGELTSVFDPTQVLNHLVRDIEKNWAALESNLKQDIQAIFKVDEVEPGRFRVRS